ncbi:uncharacterized protein LOC128641929 [Bombina bombina]|uniref:uncharacterized protein LOC128641929 n=1 Tax=Bombina bombina TaxID=8345 RepID=UPI00235B1B7C|nr:uncharacterized protein LOC128641929 [Bombina bombina]
MGSFGHQGCLFFLGLLVTLTSAANTCLYSSLNETALCENATSISNITNLCSYTFKDFACSTPSTLNDFPSDLLVTLTSCNLSVSALSPTYSSLFFSKLNVTQSDAVFSNLNKNFTILPPGWAQFLFEGIWVRITQNWNISSWIPKDIQPFLVFLTSDMVQCLQSKNATCPSFQELLQGLNVQFPKMSELKGKELYSSIKTFLNNQKNTTGSACSLNVNSSTWIEQNIGKFSQFAEYEDFVALKPNFSALDVFSILTLPQVVSFSLAENVGNNKSVADLIVGRLQNSSDVYVFLDNLNSALVLKNVTSVPQALSQALVNRTFQVLGPNFSSFSTSDWSQLFQKNLDNIVAEISTEQLVLIPKNITCPSYQAVFKGLNDKFSKLKPDIQNYVYASLIKTYHSQNKCSVIGSNSSDWLQQNFGDFSQFAAYADFTALNSSFSGLDAISLLTISQVVDLSLVVNYTANTDGGQRIATRLQNPNDVYTFFYNLNTLKNVTSVSQALSQALVNRTFQVLGPNFSSFNTSDWSQLFQKNLDNIVAEISTEQLVLIPKNITCPSYQAVFKGLNDKFSKLKPDIQNYVYASLIKTYHSQNKCSVIGSNSSDWLQQNFGDFSQFAAYADFTALNSSFSGLDAISLLTISQVVDLSLVVNYTDNTDAGQRIATRLQNPNDVYTFFYNLNTLKNPSSVPTPLSQALLKKSFIVLQPSFSSYTPDDWSQFIQKNLTLVLPEISTEQLKLIPLNINCSSYQAIIQSFNSKASTLKTGVPDYIYKSIIKSYLAKKDSAPKCYNSGDANSSSWFVTNMGSFLSFTSEEDLRSFANDSMLQMFAQDPATIQLTSQLNLSRDIAVYYTSLLTSGSISLSSFPDYFLCYLSGQGVKQINNKDSLEWIKKINKQCNNSQTGASPRPEEIEVAVSLVSKLSNIDSSVINTLGQSAVGLSTSQITNINASDIANSLPNLSKVKGWNRDQAKSIVTKLNITSQEKNLDSLGSLVIGLSSQTVQNLEPNSILNATQKPEFALQLNNAPSTLQNTFVKKILAVNSTPSAVVKNVPSSLASYVPKSLLYFKSEKPNVQDLNGKSWTPEQASMFFDTIAQDQTNFSTLSPSVLQGFTCGTYSKLSSAQFKDLAKAIKTQNANLGDIQMNCLAKRLVNISGIPDDVNNYPTEMLMFISVTNYSAFGGCNGFYSKIATGNVNILAKGSKLRTNLLNNALSCMNVSGTSLTSENVQVLGPLVCDLNSPYILNNPNTVLPKLSICSSFTADQESAIQKSLSQNTAFGLPSSWTQSTLKSLGKMTGIFNKDIVGNISIDALKSWMKSAIQNSELTRGQFAAIVKNRTPTISKRAVGCSEQQITADNIMDETLPLTYASTTQLDVCLDNATLQNYLGVLGNKTFTDAQLLILKSRLDQLYPDGYPDSVISSLGAIATVCTETDVKKWNLTSVDTLNSLLQAQLPDNLAKAVIVKHIEQAGPLTSITVNALGGKYVCQLNTTQVNLISADVLSSSQALIISSCNQTLKNALYLIANSSFQSYASDAKPYYTLKQPYLGGALASDLKSLSPNNINMDIGTFLNLNSESIMNLSVSDLKGLLGINVADLKDNENTTVVSSWARAQTQSDLNTLGVGLTGGRADTTTSTTKSTISTRTLPSGINNVPLVTSSASVVSCCSFICVLMMMLVV